MKRSIIFSLIMTCAFFISLEMAARCYKYIKYKETSVFLYGKDYIVGLFRRNDDPNKWPREFSKQVKAADEIYNDRSLILKKPPQLTLSHPWQSKVLNNGVLVYYNNFGFRNNDMEFKKSPGTIRVMTMGGSFVEAVKVEDTLTWTYILNDKLKSAPVKYEVINAGTAGGELNYLLQLLITDVAKFEPDYIILFSTVNNHQWVNPQLTFQWEISRFFYGISELYAMLYDRAMIRNYRDGLGFYDFQMFNVSARKEKIETAMALYRKRLEQIAVVCKENNIKLILALQPEVIPLQLKDLQDPLNEGKVAELDEKLGKQSCLLYNEFEYYLEGRFNLAMKKYAEANSILLFDGVSLFSENKKDYFYDQMHLNEKGNRRLAEALYDFFINLGLTRNDNLAKPLN